MRQSPVHASFTLELGFAPLNHAKDHVLAHGLGSGHPRASRDAIYDDFSRKVKTLARGYRSLLQTVSSKANLPATW